MSNYSIYLGEYGYKKFREGETGSRSYQLENSRSLTIGDHCIRFFYYFSDGYSNASIKVVLEDSQTFQNVTILTASLYFGNKWHQIRENFRTFRPISKVSFLL